VDVNPLDFVLKGGFFLERKGIFLLCYSIDYTLIFVSEEEI
jgi:hypothetical protein